MAWSSARWRPSWAVDRDFREGAVRLVAETGKPIAQVAQDSGINAGTLANWVARDRRHGGDGALSEDERAELARLRRENNDGQTIERPDRRGDDQASDLLLRVGMAGLNPRPLDPQDGGGAVSAAQPMIRTYVRSSATRVMLARMHRVWSPSGPQNWPVGGQGVRSPVAARRRPSHRSQRPPVGQRPALLAHAADAQEGTGRSCLRAEHGGEARRPGPPRTAADPAAAARAGRSQPAWRARQGGPPSRAGPCTTDAHRV